MRPSLSAAGRLEPLYTCTRTFHALRFSRLSFSTCFVATAQAQEGEAPWELYNLATDRGETTNLADAQPERVKALAQVWQTRWQAYQADAKRE